MGEIMNTKEDLIDFKLKYTELKKEHLNLQKQFADLGKEHAKTLKALNTAQWSLDNHWIQTLRVRDKNIELEKRLKEKPRPVLFIEQDSLMFPQTQIELLMQFNLIWIKPGAMAPQIYEAKAVL
jgi:hypothetical protein